MPDPLFRHENGSEVREAILGPDPGILTFLTNRSYFEGIRHT